MSTATSYNTIENSADMYDSRPLFGVRSRRELIINWTLAGISILFILITLICSFIYPQKAIKGSNIFFSICIIFLGLSHLILIYWYRMGDLDPKFLKMIYFNAVMFNLLCLCANLSIHNV